MTQFAGHVISAASFFLLTLVSIDDAFCEHRVALILAGDTTDDTAFDSDRLAAALTANGFRCTTIPIGKEKQLKSAIEDFARRTPTLGTALICFAGTVAAAGADGTDQLMLQGTDSRPGRGVKLSDALNMLHTLGGSTTNITLLTHSESPATPVPTPPRTIVATCNESVITKLAAGDPVFVAIQPTVISAAESLTESTRRASVSISPPDQFREGTRPGDEWVNARGMVFCWCPQGSVTTGSPPDTPGRYPDEEQRDVNIEHGFWIGKYELTLSQNLRNRPRSTIASDKNHPVTMLHHDDAKNMVLRTLTESERKAGRLPNDWQYSLPTEQQWEYAARAGTTSRWYFGEDMKQLVEHANFADRSWYDSGDIFSNAAHRELNDNSPRLSIAGSCAANPWGLHDVYGNVAEWCLNHAVRGGSWVSVPQNCRSAYRDSFPARSERNYIGYRLVIQKVPKDKTN